MSQDPVGLPVPHPDIVMVEKHQRTALVKDVAITSNSNIRKMKHKKLKKYQGLKEELEKVCGQQWC